MTLLAIEGLRFGYAGRDVLRGIDLAVERGRTLAIIGPSGSGKSTLIRCINLLEEGWHGRITFDGLVLPNRGRGAHALRRRIGMVFQNFELFPHLSALENAMVGPVHALGQTRAAAAAKALAALARVGLADRGESYPDELSGGQQQRVAIARALAMDPALMLYDEPTSALDPETTRSVLEVIAALSRDGMTSIIVTHEMAFARRVSDAVAFMEDGLVVELGAPGCIFETPREPRTRAFLAGVAGC